MIAELIPDATTRATIYAALADPARLRIVDFLALGDASSSDLVVTVCDLAHESLNVDRELHWSIPDPVSEGTPEAFDAAYDEIESRVSALASRLDS